MEMRSQMPSRGAAPAEHSPALASVANASSSLLNKLLSIALILAALTFMGYYATRAIGSLTADSAVKGKQYQAVFLTNGQVYFGKVSSVDSSYVKLSNIYYLQVQQTVQPKDSSSSANNNQQVSLAKLGGELHGPEDSMFISRSQVLFWENLKDDGKVVKAIKDYIAQGNK
ncbi:MAG TPA: hypothetical protein VLI05_06485 [Candidatus Saccharimonadia bacterium]|nr:hypothetical protein [Candidatus Saccharimonadia bacterium]